MQKLLMVDMDGVLADCSGRLHYAQEKNYEEFFSCSNMMRDKMIVKGISLVSSLATAGYEIVLVTGRPERTRECTKSWLNKHAKSLCIDRILMRKDGDYRPASVIKPEMVEAFLKCFGDGTLNSALGEWDSILFIDDFPQNVSAVCALSDKILGLVFGTEHTIGL